MKVGIQVLFGNFTSQPWWSFSTLVESETIKIYIQSVLGRHLLLNSMCNVCESACELCMNVKGLLNGIKLKDATHCLVF